MKMLRNWSSAALVLFLATMTPGCPALALTQQQWMNVCTNFLGLRSGANPGDSTGAGFGMDDGNKDPRNCMRAPPTNWDSLLQETLATIKGFRDSGNRYLLIVTRCPGLSRDYKNDFPKCNRVQGQDPVVAATPQTLANYTVQQLIQWVNAHV